MQKLLNEMPLILRPWNQFQKFVEITKLGWIILKKTEIEYAKHPCQALFGCMRLISGWPFVH